MVNIFRPALINLARTAWDIIDHIVMLDLPALVRKKQSSRALKPACPAMHGLMVQLTEEENDVQGQAD